MATTELKPEKMAVMIPNGDRSEMMLPPVEEPKMDGIRALARPRTPDGVVSCVAEARFESVNAPCGRLGTPPGVVTF